MESIQKIIYQVVGMMFRKIVVLIYDMQRKMDKNRRVLITSLTLDNVISDLIVVYKEVFSDMAASMILECDEDQFISVSEGVKKGENSLESIYRNLYNYV